MVKDIVIREAYEKDGAEQVSWNKIGILIEKGDKQYVKLNHIPNTMCMVYEQKKKGEAVDQTEEIPF